jgi:hypothetical protein
MNNSQRSRNTFGPTLYLNNMFDEEFLKQKESALSPIFLDDTIHNPNTNKLKLEKNLSKNKLSISSDIKKSKKSLMSSYGYGSNIILISSKQDDDPKENPVVAEFNKLMMGSQILTKRRQNI